MTPLRTSYTFDEKLIDKLDVDVVHKNFNATVIGE